MKQRLDKRPESDDKEAFNLDIVDCKDARSAEDYLSGGFADLFKYPFRCLVFFPRDKVGLDVVNVDFLHLNNSGVNC